MSGYYDETGTTYRIGLYWRVDVWLWEFHNYVEQLLQRPVFTHELATEDVQKEIKEKARPAFLMLCQED